MKFDPYMYRYPSRRNLVYGKNGMVGSASPLACQIGLDIMKKGGNAVDAAIATAAALTVVEPSGNGIGGDCFAIVWIEGEMYGLNASGAAPLKMTSEAIQSKGYKEITKFGLDPVSVPGVPSGWAALSERFGKLPLSDVLEPAAKLAEEGFPVSVNVSRLWNRYYKIYSNALKDYPVLQTWFDTFCPNGHPLQAGELFKSEGHAKTLREIGATNAASFYTGAIADEIDAFSREHGGFIRKEDLANHQVEWVKPLSVNYRGYDVWELPPNGIGIMALMALNILENFDLKGKEETDTYHYQIEAMKLAFSDGMAYIGEPSSMRADVDTLISKEYAKQRAALIQEGESLTPSPGELDKAGTVYFSTADKDGNMVSFIQSCYTGFGSGAVVPGYGISLHNRGCQFTLEPNHPNELKPGKRPLHTIIPGFITKDNQPVGPFGVMGGPLQPQAHMQVVSSMVDFHLNPQDALDAPRWQWVSGKKVQVEHALPFHITEALMRRGHEIEVLNETIMLGRGQIIIRNKDGVLVGGTEPRSDGYLAVW
ncbi:gamma-glutamyltransferase [Erysipelothrix inopinata]|uniref:Glutathione hydrolase proenzyme n=1 Tax=Erysipelothrix inopinata TaxID=225084 RepID=A0A7G9RY42_9FIRM|nr:gamma-glutamyltransferase [Erysipelothrix inopinata]QNN60517.1 gamma-glutamyltransferase [Erysipelothrix inopinata]